MEAQEILLTTIIAATNKYKARLLPQVSHMWLNI